jgi:sugar lactone lactonase YvrE
VNTVAGNGRFRYGGEGTPALATPLATDLIVSSNFLGGSTILVDHSGVLYIAEIRGNRVRKVVNGVVTTAIGNGGPASSGDGGQATSASVLMPAGMARDPAGNLYVSEGDVITVGRIRKVAPNGVISTFADQVVCPVIATDPAGTLYGGCLDATVRKFAANGTSTIIAGTSGMLGFTGDGGPASKALIGFPEGLAIDRSGTIYFADFTSERVRKIDSKGVITTIAGTGDDASTGDGGPAKNAAITPGAMILDSAGNLLVCDLDGNRVRKIDTNGVISTIAGGGTVLVSGDGQAATAASIHRPISLALDAAGNLFILDIFNSRVREVLVTTPTVQVPVTSLSFTASSGGAAVLGSFSVIGSITGLQFQVSSDSPWLTVDAAVGATPRLIHVMADPTALAPGTYKGNITVHPTAALPASFTVAVTLQVGASKPAQLAVDQPSLSFTFPK